jgi:hypothetical protein
MHTNRHGRGIHIACIHKHEVFVQTCPWHATCRHTYPIEKLLIQCQQTTLSHTQTHTHTVKLLIIHTCAVSSSVQSVFFSLLHEHCITVTRPENKISMASSSSYVYDRCVYDNVCIGVPISIETRTHMDAAYIHMKQITTSHTCSHTLPPLLPWPNTPSHPRSLTHVSDVSWSKMPAGSTLIALSYRLRYLGTTRGGSHPPAHARCVHQQAHACAPCTCAMHMRHAHARVHRGSLSLWICAHQKKGRRFPLLHLFRMTRVW